MYDTSYWVQFMKEFNDESYENRQDNARLKISPDKNTSFYEAITEMQSRACCSITPLKTDDQGNYRYYIHWYHDKVKREPEEQGE